jgi:UDP-3-O-[3-hydroxymyristoyl] glucosamine N-acyltransferase
MALELKLAKISEMLGGTLKGDPNYVVSSISNPEKYVQGSISPLWEKKFVHDVVPGTVLLTKKNWIPEGCSGIEVDEPRLALITLLEYFDRANGNKIAGIHKSAVIDPSSKLGKNVTIGPDCILSEETSIGDNTILKGKVWVGSNVNIGSDCVIEPGVVLYDKITIGDRCLIHANAVIGCDGFGFVPDPKTVMRRIPQIGTVIIEDDVEIGVGTTIDRATFGETRIARGTKIDAQVKIGHNCHVGEYSIIVAQSGLAGSSTIGKGVTLAAQSGVANHSTVGDGAVVASRSAAVSDIPAGMTVSGFPAQEHLQDMRQLAIIRHLPEIEKTVKSLAAAVKKMELGNK